jgi:16S rRNA (cytosine967-C5)-methyltransferase
MKPREIAAAVLNPAGNAVEYVENRLDNALRENVLSDQDRRLAQELAYGVLRWQRALDWLIERKTQGRPQKPFLQTLLRLGLYQLFWLDRIPSHAAVNEAVDLAKKRGFVSQAGFINAVLRAYVREQAATDILLRELKEKQPDLGYSHPAWLFERWDRAWGREATVRLMEWNNSPPPVYARLNTLRATRDQLAAAWSAEGVAFKAAAFDWTGEGLVFALESHPSLNDLPSFRQGMFYVQDPSTVMAVMAMDLQSGHSVLDACSAPGGKTTLIAQIMKDQGRLVAEDSDPSRRAMVEENCRRLGVRGLELITKQDEQFDRVLVDAPCSNTGVARRRVELRWRLQAAEISRLAQEQERILRRNAERLNPGGLIVYSTCSLEPEENHGVVSRFLASDPRFQLESERQLLPWKDGVDGAYVAALRRQPA